MNKQRSAFYNGIKFVDIDNVVRLPTDYESDRIPNKGDILCFQIINGNQSDIHHCEVLYIYDNRTGLGVKKFEDMEIISISIFVITKRIVPELGERTWKSIYNLTSNNNDEK